MYFKTLSFKKRIHTFQMYNNKFRWCYKLLIFKIIQIVQNRRKMCSIITFFSCFINVVTN